MSNNTTLSLISILPAIQFRMSTIVMPLLLFFGSGGNILNALVFLQKTFRSNSCSMYMISGYLLHTLVLCFAMSTTLYSLTHKDPLTYNISYCKTRHYLISSIFTMARCCVGMACFDRFAISSSNPNIRSFGRPRIARYIITFIIIIWFILPIHLIIFNIIQNGQCIMSGLYSYFFAGYVIITSAIIPPSMMITFSILAAKNIRQIRQRVQPLPITQNHITNNHSTTNSGNRGARIKQYDYQLLKMLLVDVIIYCISAVPSPIYYIYAAITLKSIKSAEETAWQKFLNYLAYQFLLYIAASTSLYTNLLVSKTFRNEFQLFLNRYIFKRRELIANNATGPAYIGTRNDLKSMPIQQLMNTRRNQHEHETNRV